MLCHTQPVFLPLLPPQGRAPEHLMKNSVLLLPPFFPDIPHYTILWKNSERKHCESISSSCITIRLLLQYNTKGRKKKTWKKINSYLPSAERLSQAILLLLAQYCSLHPLQGR